MIHSRLEYNVVVIKEQRVTIASIIKEIVGKSTYVTYSTYCISIAALCLRNNVMNHISKEIFKKTDGQ
jgi:hypothetical protein